MFKCFAICAVLPSVFGFGFETQESCITPANEKGQCIVISECLPLYGFLEKRQNINYLRASHCGYEGVLPKVCCSVKSDIKRDPRDLLPDIDICGTGGYNLGHSRIIGGIVTGLLEYPWAVLLSYKKPSGVGFHCGGTLINNKYVLTAAHCVNKIPRGWTLVGVRLGEYDLDKETDCELDDCTDPPIDIPIIEKIVHEGYNPNTRNQPNDIALLRLSREVKFTKSILPICLPRSSEFLNNRLEELTMTVVGWGRTETGASSNVKLKLDVPIKPFDNCSTIYKSAGVRISEDQFCAGGVKDKDSCTGDSGGPLMLFEDSWYIAGIVSFGPTPCGVTNWPGVYTKVSNYIEWILAKIRS